MHVEIHPKSNSVRHPHDYCRKINNNNNNSSSSNSVTKNKWKWNSWIEKNSKPREILKPPQYRPPSTRFNSGKMKSYDWDHFDEWYNERNKRKTLKENSDKSIKDVYRFSDLDNNNERYKVLQEWIQKNSKPRKYSVPENKPIRTRFNSGAMKLEDWLSFHEWCKEKAKPREIPKPEEKPSRKVELEKLLPRINKLSIPKAIHVKNDKKSSITVNKISENLNKIKCNTKGRKYKKKRFPHTEAEAEYWSNLRFPVAKKAIKYKINDRLMELATPKPINKQESKNEKRTKHKMTPRQWLQHLRYLKTFAHPRRRLSSPKIEVPPRQKIPITHLRTRVQYLAKPKLIINEEPKNVWKIPKSALNAKPTKRILELATPVSHKTNFEKKRKNKNGSDSSSTNRFLTSSSSCIGSINNKYSNYDSISSNSI